MNHVENSDFTTNEVAKVLNCSKQTIWKAIKAGRLKATKPGKRNHRITAVELARFRGASNG